MLAQDVERLDHAVRRAVADAPISSSREHLEQDILTLRTRLTRAHQDVLGSNVLGMNVLMALQGLELKIRNLELALAKEVTPPLEALSAETVCAAGVPKDGPLTGISGTITDEGTGLGVANTPVRIRDAGGFFIAQTFAGAAGDYEVTGLAAGTYYVSTDGAVGLIDEIYDDVPCPSSNCTVSIGDPITVTQDAITTGIDLALAEGGGISGTVTDVGTAAPIANAILDIFHQDGIFIESVLTDGSGNYTTSTGLITGSYRVRTRGVVGYIDEVWDDIVCLNCNPLLGDPIAVTSPTTTTGIDFALAPGGGIAGTVSDAGSANPLENVFDLRLRRSGHFRGVRDVRHRRQLCHLRWATRGRLLSSGRSTSTATSTRCGTTSCASAVIRPKARGSRWSPPVRRQASTSA